jgi:hypothetical protein
MIKTVFTVALACLLPSCSLQPAFAKGKPDDPSAVFCWLARGCRAMANSDKQAETEARARGVSDNDIAKAKRCRR